MVDKDQQLLEFLADFIETNGYAPSYTEMMNGTDDKSKNGINIRLGRLVKSGHIKRVPNVARSIQVVHLPSRDPSLG